MTITHTEFELGVWNLVRKEIINVPTHVGYIIGKSTVTSMTTTRNFEVCSTNLMHGFTEAYSPLSSEDGSNHRIAGKGVPHTQLGAFALLFANHMQILRSPNSNSARVSVYHTEQAKWRLITVKMSRRLCHCRSV
jgi:hypothetical protein